MLAGEFGFLARPEIFISTYSMSLQTYRMEKISKNLKENFSKRDRKL